jgi:hypothetical protein
MLMADISSAPMIGSGLSPSCRHPLPRSREWVTMSKDKPQQQPAASATDIRAPAAVQRPKSSGKFWWLLVLLIVGAFFGWEALAFYGYQTSSQSIAEAMQRESGKPSAAEATDMLVGFPQESSDAGDTRPTQTYRWRGLFMEYGGVRLSIDPDTQVVEVFEMGIPTREEEEDMQMEYEPLPGSPSASPQGGGSTPMGGSADESQAQPEAAPGEESSDQ